MNYIEPSNRHQLNFGSLEDAVEQNNPVRFVEAFVEPLVSGISGVRASPRQRHLAGQATRLGTVFFYILSIVLINSSIYLFNSVEFMLSFLLLPVA